MADMEEASKGAIVPVGPAAIGTVPTSVTLGVWTITPGTAAVWPRGLKARSAAVFGPLTPPTFWGVQIWPVLGSRNCCCPDVVGAWATLDDAAMAPRAAARHPRRSDFPSSI